MLNCLLLIQHYPQRGRQVSERIFHNPLKNTIRRRRWWYVSLLGANKSFWCLRSLWIIHLNDCLLLFGPVSQDQDINPSLSVWQAKSFPRYTQTIFIQSILQRFSLTDQCLLSKSDRLLSVLLEIVDCDISSHSADHWLWKVRLHWKSKVWAPHQSCPFWWKAGNYKSGGKAVCKVAGSAYV